MAGATIIKWTPWSHRSATGWTDDVGSVLYFLWKNGGGPFFGRGLGMKGIYSEIPALFVIQIYSSLIAAKFQYYDMFNT
ncbi:hypothetical protein [Natrarchaeobius chitinivorans]|uniref:Uncharacterized protein n=1 Tax=Natrarchaeobius chitinivorans TaxID=1679083 RepID=A0A3N6P0C1_NATCH|nr:hypothetical protein [Natrarchaeobius chitinivorans]RQG90829.1 hypothetical protein EA473_19670 [Natrarchaeobius chitinivorans]